MEEVRYLYHGTTSNNAKNIEANGFENRPIMFSPFISEASRYANSYCYKTEYQPTIIAVDYSLLNINTSGLFEADRQFIVQNWKCPEKILDKHCYDGYLSDPRAYYYVMVNIAKLNSILRDSKIRIWKLT